MLLRNVENTEQYHVPTGVGRLLVDRGLAVEVKPEPKPLAPTRWIATFGSSSNIYPPIIKVSCPNCNQSSYAESVHGTAHEAITFRHVCGPAETCPDDVADQYIEMFKTWRQNDKAARAAARNRR